MSSMFLCPFSTTTTSERYLELVPTVGKIPLCTTPHHTPPIEWNCNSSNHIIYTNTLCILLVPKSEIVFKNSRRSNASYYGVKKQKEKTAKNEKLEYGGCGSTTPHLHHPNKSDYGGRYRNDIVSNVVVTIIINKIVITGRIWINRESPISTITCCQVLWYP